MTHPEASKLASLSPTMWEVPDFVRWWSEEKTSHSLALRNTGRIEQLEAGQQELKACKAWIVAVLRAAKDEAICERPHTTREKAVYFVGSWGSGKSSLAHSWTSSKPVSRVIIGSTLRHLEQEESLYAEEFSEVAKLCAELQEDFEDVTLRIPRCALLEEALGALEDELDEDETEYLSWGVSLLRDVLDYNYAEDLTESGLEIIGRGIEAMCTKNVSYDKEDYGELHRELLGTGLALLPTSRKAKEKYGREESGYDGEKLLFS